MMKIFSIICLLVVFAASLFQFHGHDCLGHLIEPAQFAKLSIFSCKHHHQCIHSNDSPVSQSLEEQESGARHSHPESADCGLHIDFAKPFIPDNHSGAASVKTLKIILISFLSTGITDSQVLSFFAKKSSLRDLNPFRFEESGIKTIMPLKGTVF